ncbi:MAG: hypothetical protein MUD14_15405 [Hydrococcus sp. Prado102]|jgi:hypothetical protein|nr:hypothetical protein [Hydrococcus sp. Prado102]
MIKQVLVKSLIAVGITIWAIPFLSAALVGLIIVALVRIKEKVTFTLFPASRNEIS